MSKLTPLLFSGLIALPLLAGAAQAQSNFDLSIEQADRPRAERDEAAIALISPDYQFTESGKFTVAVSPYEPPVAAYADDSTSVAVGADPDLSQLIADAFGLELNLVPVAWPDWPLGVISGKYDAVISNVTVTEERKERFDFSTYRLDVLGFYVPNESPITEIDEPADIAGLRVITGAGTNQEKIILEWDRQNVEAGLEPIEVQYYDDRAASLLALQSGRADVEFNPNASLAYTARVSGALRHVGTVNGGWPLTAEIAVTTRKDAGLADALTQAINTLIANGKYGEALARWNLEAEALSESRTNPPGLPRT